MNILYSKDNDGIALSVVYLMNQLTGFTEDSEENDEEVVIVLTDKFIASGDCLIEAENLRRKAENNNSRIFVIVDKKIKRIPERYRWLNINTFVWISNVCEVRDACLKIFRSILFGRDYQIYREMNYSKLIEGLDDSFIHDMVKIVEECDGDVKAVMLMVNVLYRYIIMYGIGGKKVNRQQLTSKCIEFIMKEKTGTGDFSFMEYELAQTCLKRLMY